MNTRRSQTVAFVGVLFALSLVLGLLEGYVTPLLGLPPGVKPGLANIVVMFCALYLSRRSALLLVLLKAGSAVLLRGLVAGALSLAGGLLSWAVLALLLMLPGRGASLWLLSASGALAHNLGQMLVVSLLFGRMGWAYAPVLLVSGLAMGSLTAGLLRVLLPTLKKAIPAQKRGKTEDE